MLSNHCNVTGLLRRLQVDIQVFKIIKQNGDVFKNWLCPNFLSVPKKSELPKIWGGCSPPRPPPGPYTYGNKYKSSNISVHVSSNTSQVTKS